MSRAGNTRTATAQQASNSEGVGHQSKSTYCLDSAPAWWLRIVLGSLAGLVAGNLWNRLVGLGWRLARLRKGSWRRLLPYNRVVREVAEKVVELLRLGAQLDVLGSPRVGKSAGATLGIVRRHTVHIKPSRLYRESRTWPERCPSIVSKHVCRGIAY